MLDEYLPVLIFLGLAIAISCVMVAIPMLVSWHRPSMGKLARYECGFEPISSARASFDIRFYLVAILFILFDLEIVFLFPWALALKEIGYLGLFSMLFFLFMLIIGFVYEWKNGALEWE